MRGGRLLAQLSAPPRAPCTAIEATSETGNGLSKIVKTTVSFDTIDNCDLDNVTGGLLQTMTGVTSGTTGGALVGEWGRRARASS